jgi:hypothetical protein
MINMEFLSLIIGLIAGFGWFFCLGHLIVGYLGSKQLHYSHIFGISAATTIATLGLFTPWIALPNPIPHVIGLLLVFGWIIIRPPLPIVKRPPFTLIFFGCMVLFTIYAISYLLFPDWSFDSLSYHLPFIHHFAASGQIPLPDNPINWVDHVTFVFPKGVETLFGLGEMLVPNSQGILQFIILLATFACIERLSQRAGVNRPFLGGLLFLATTRMVNISKAFMVEQTIFLLFTLFLIILWEDRKSIHPSSVPIVFILAMSLTMAKINAFVYVGIALLIVYYFTRSHQLFLTGVAGGIAGLVATYSLPFWKGIDLFLEFQIVQALTHSQTIPMVMRLDFLWRGLSTHIPTTIGIGVLLAVLLLIYHKESRFLTLTLIASIMAFIAVFAASNLFLFTYSQIWVYLFAFIGLTAIPIAIFLDGAVNPRFNVPLRDIGGIIALLVVAGALWSGANGIAYMSKGFFLMGTADSYPHLLENVPNEPSTNLLFMNNINPITFGLEKATITDFTHYPVMEGDPCGFWRDQNITHIAYWWADYNMFQIYGENPIFYQDAKASLRASECTTLLYDMNSFGIMIARMNTEES